MATIRLSFSKSSALYTVANWKKRNKKQRKFKKSSTNAKYNLLQKVKWFDKGVEKIYDNIKFNINAIQYSESFLYARWDGKIYSLFPMENTFRRVIIH